MDDSTLPALTIHEARALLDSRQVSSVDLTKAVLNASPKSKTASRLS